MDFQLVVSLVLTLVVPAVVSYLKNTAWAKWQRIAAAGFISVVASGLALFAQGELKTFADLAVHGAVVWAGATANYKLWFGNTDLNMKLEASGIGSNRP